MMRISAAESACATSSNLPVYDISAVTNLSSVERMIRVAEGARKWIVEDRGCLFKSDLMFSGIERGLELVPCDIRVAVCLAHAAYTPTGKGLGLDSSVVLAPPDFQRSKRPCSRLMKPV